MEALIQSLVEKHYNLTGNISSLPGDIDLNFKLDTKEGASFIIKLMQEDCAKSLIDLQASTLIHLESNATSIDLPKVIRSTNNQAFEMVEVNGIKRILWILSYCQGDLYAHFSPHTNSLAQSFGSVIAHITNGLADFEHPAMNRNHRWKLTEALQSKGFTPHIQGPTQVIVKDVFDQFETKILSSLDTLPHSAIHSDANDYNVLVSLDQKGKAKVSGIFDFGDMAYQPTICEVAIALAYAILGKDKPLRACYHFLQGYTTVRTISELELDVLFHLIKTRLAVSIAISSYRQIEEPEDSYLTISQQPAKDALEKLDHISPKKALSFFRKACGYPVTKETEAILQFLENTKAHPVMQVDHFNCILDLSVGSTLLGADPQGFQLNAFSKKINDFMDEQKATFSIGRYCESRRIYDAENFGVSGHPTQERRNIHLGIDLFCDAGKAVYAPFDAVVEVNTYIELPLDYGGLLILKHETDQGIPFYILYGHLDPKSLTFRVGEKITAGTKIAEIGNPSVNGGWPPHLHLQIISDFLDLGLDFPGVAYYSELDIWKSICPNPMLLFEVPDITTIDASVDVSSLLENRKKRLGYNLSLSYEKPIHAVAGFKQFLFDSYANTYLDFYNNVPHVGHQHPKVVQAVQKQAALLNTNTRYLHHTILEYAEQLTDKLPAHLEVCYFVNSASEANELAIRMARAYTKRKDIIVAESAYHGHTNTLIEISPYKHNGPGGEGAPDWVHTVPIADDYRGKWKRDNPQAGLLYANEVKEILDSIKKSGRSAAALIAETYPSVGGQIILPDGYLKAVYQHVRDHGAICIADEVQTGFGRLGDSYWAFETQGAEPDMVILGKPIANGFPMGALVTTKEIAKAFDNGMEYFSTFGGNPVSCTAAIAVMDVVKNESLQANATKLGQLILDAFRKLKDKYSIIGDVRGEGLFLGMELVRDQKTLEAADHETRYVVNRLKEFHILAGIDGPLHNVLKFRPSMVSTESDVAYFIETLDQIFSETYLRV